MEPKGFYAHSPSNPVKSAPRLRSPVSAEGEARAQNGGLFRVSPTKGSLESSGHGSQLGSSLTATYRLLVVFRASLEH